MSKSHQKVTVRAVPPDEPSAVSQAINRINVRIWEINNELTALANARSALEKLEAADEKVRAAAPAKVAERVRQVLTEAVKKAAPAKKKPGALSAAARRRIAAAQKKRWAEYRKLPTNTAKPAPAKPAAKTSFVERMRKATNADAGRKVIRQLEQEINRLQHSIGMRPTVGQVDPQTYHGFSAVPAKDWNVALAEAKDRAPSTAARIAELFREGLQMEPLWIKLQDAELRPLTQSAGGGDAQ